MQIQEAPIVSCNSFHWSSRLFSSRYLCSVTCVSTLTWKFDQSSPWQPSDSSSLPHTLAAIHSFIQSVSLQRSADQIDGAVSHLTGRLPPHCTQSGAPISLKVLLQSQCHQNGRQNEKCIHLQTTRFIIHFICNINQMSAGTSRRMWWSKTCSCIFHRIKERDYFHHMLIQFMMREWSDNRLIK